MSKRPERCQRGFTLLEVLISLVLLGFLLAALGQGLRFGLGAWDLQEQMNSRTEALETTDRSLRRLIETMEPAGVGAVQSVVAGYADRLSFIGSLPAATIDRRAEMSLMLTKEGRLVLRWRPHRHERPMEKPPESEVLLLDGVAKLTLAYWRPATSAIKGGWVDAWSLPGLPSLVRIRLEFGPNDRRHWPDIVIAPVLEAPVN